ncbi:MAG: hypothetical protein ACOYT8_04980 [Candidatus Dependentiae bacterium]
MKKILLLTLAIASTQLVSMEKEQTSFPLEQLLPELKTEILKHVVDAPSISDAITNLQNIRFVNKDLYDQITNNTTILFGVLNSLLTKFPGSETAIARALNTKLAEEWLKKVNPNASFNVISTNDQQFNTALEYIRSGDLNSLKQWLDKGYNPKYRQFNGWTLDSYAVEYGISVPVLELLSKYNPDIFSLKNIKELLFLAQKAIMDQDVTAEYSEKMPIVIDFLEQKLYQQLSPEEAMQIINDIDARVKAQLGIQ